MLQPKPDSHLSDIVRAKVFARFEPVAHCALDDGPVDGVTRIRNKFPAGWLVCDAVLVNFKLLRQNQTPSSHLLPPRLEIHRPFKPACCRQHPPSFIRDPQPRDLRHLAARDHALGVRGRKPGLDHSACATVSLGYRRRPGTQPQLIGPTLAHHGRDLRASCFRYTKRVHKQSTLVEIRKQNQWLADTSANPATPTTT